MAKRDTRIDLLSAELRKALIEDKHLGEKDAEIYMKLFEVGEGLTIKQVNDSTGISTSTIRDSLTKMFNQSLIEREPTQGDRRSAGRLYRAKAPTKVLSDVFEKYRKRENAIEILEELYFETQEPPAKYDGLWLSKPIQGSQLRNEVKKAKKSVWICSGDCSWIRDIIEEIDQQTKKGVNVKVLATFEGSEGKESLKYLRGHKEVELKKIEKSFIPFCIIDGKVFAFFYREVGKYYCAHCESVYLKEKFKNLFNILEKGGKAI